MFVVETDKTVTNWKDKRGTENRGLTIAHDSKKKKKMTIITSQGQNWPLTLWAPGNIMLKNIELTVA